MYVLIFTFFFSSLQIFAIDFEDAVFPELATSSRALAMGNAYISKTDDSSAVFYNPAGLGTIRFPHFHLSNFQFETNKGWLNSTGGGKATDVVTNISKAFSLDGTRNILRKNKGDVSHARFHLLPNFTMRHISIGYLYSFQQRAIIGKEATSKFEYAQRKDVGPYLALNLPIFGGIWKIGASVIYLSRKEINDEAAQDQTLTVTDNDYNMGKMFLVTAGTKFTIPVMFLPTFALTMHNASSKSFHAKDGAGLPDKIKSSMDIGFSLTPQIGQVMRMHMEINYKDMTGQYSAVDTTRKLLAGLEFDFARIMYFRLGYGDGFGSAGIGVRTQKLEFDLTTYAVDTTAKGFRGNEDRRFVIGFSTGF